MDEVLIEIYLANISVHRVKDITKALCGRKVSPGTISNLNKKAYEHIETWRTRPLSGNYPYVYVDGVYLKRSWGARFRIFLSLLPLASVRMAAGKSLVLRKG